VGCIAGPSASEFHRNGRLDAARAAALAALPGWEWDGDVGGTRESLSRGLRFSIGAPVADPPVSGLPIASGVSFVRRARWRGRPSTG